MVHDLWRLVGRDACSVVCAAVPSNGGLDGAKGNIYGDAARN